MNMFLALKIFYMGTKFGLHSAKLGFEPSKMLEDDVLQVMSDGFNIYKDEIETFVKDLLDAKNQRDWYTENMSARSIYRLGLIRGFDESSQMKPDSRGDKILDEYTIDKITQKTFAQFSSQYRESVEG